jgi:hypothetical protein
VLYEDMVLTARAGVDPEWGCFSWPSADILPAEEVESARRRMDRRIFEQEYLGKFVFAGGRAFSDFNPALHVRPTAYDPSLPICWSLDFNIDPMCSGVIQHSHGHVRVIDELTLRDTATEPACDAFLERAGRNGWNLEGLTIYGDASGWARDSTSGKSDWMIVQNRLRDFSPRFGVHNKNPLVKDSVNAVRAKVSDAEGVTRIRIDPRCAQLIDDFRCALSDKPLESQHALAWLRYFVHYEFPVVPIGPKVAGGVGFSKT